ncbi:MAG TPA: acyl-CoA dehydrogenase family protein [Amycolatopsis sp.]|nr:acyl-CoA dehydrogenase family protein [Amycolatopsis sp.]
MPVKHLLPAREAVGDATGRLRREIRDFLAGYDFSPRIDGWVTGWDPALSAELGRRGWVGMAIPVEFGGHGRSPLERHVVAEELVAAGAPVAYHWFADRQIAPAMLRYGSEYQRGRYLPAIAGGTHSFALGLSEPDAGSDLAAVRTKAAPAEGGWLLTGVKLWTSNAHRADSMTVLARTGRTSTTPRAQALSQFIVDLPAKGLTVRPIRQLGGGHHFNEVHFDNVFVPDEQVLGSIGEGWQQVTSELAWERSGPERFLSTYPLLAAAIEDGGPTTAIGSLCGAMWTMHAMSLRVAAALTRGETPAVAAALVKDLGTALEGDLVDRLDAADETLRESAVLSSPGFTLRGGSTEILRGIVAKELTR